MKILIAGLAGASLGTELLKCLSVAGGYEIYGCDISGLAYGLHSAKLVKAEVVDINNYIDSVINICRENSIHHIVPGGEQPMVLLSAASAEISSNGITVVCNNPEVVSLFSDKAKTFEFLHLNGFSIPRTFKVEPDNFQLLQTMQYPCIVKPSSGTGGSDSVFLATTVEECIMYCQLLHANKRTVIVQEYIDLEEGEFTIGVLSNSCQEIISSVAMKRIFNSKLSVAYKGEKGLISSGYSQGLIADFPEIRKQAEDIARKSGSTGPLNIQARLRNGIMIPFEINPRFSASTFLRTLAGVNEIDLYLKSLFSNTNSFVPSVKEGYYLRSFEETFIPV
jgi:carbamoyl-phosphate synthase large subunit